MARHNERTVNALLQALRERIAPETTRQEGGKGVADVIPTTGVTLTSEFASALDIPEGSVSIYMGALVKAGLLQTAQRSKSSTRWVALQGDYKNP